MKRFLLSFTMAACIVGSLSAQETLDFDYDAIIDGARGAVELTARKMPAEEVDLWISQAIEELYFNDDIDDLIIVEEAVKDIEKAESETAIQHSDEDN